MVPIRKGISIIVVSLFIAMPAFGVATVTFQNSYGSTGGGEFRATPSDFGFTPVGLEPGGFESFCVEMNEHIRFNREFFVQFSDGAVNGGVGGQDPAGGNYDPLDEMTAYLYTQFITYSLDDYDYGTGAARVDSADALQYAIWYIEDEITNPLTGLAETFYNDAYDAVHTSQTWLAGLGNVQVMNVFVDPDYTLNKQDQLIMSSDFSSGPSTPAPGAVLLGGIGVALVGWLRRRRIL